MATCEIKSRVCDLKSLKVQLFIYLMQKNYNVLKATSTGELLDIDCKFELCMSDLRTLL